ncbi:MAG: hypothetical protein J6Y28_07680 [Acholeplasmatales bacterium]|nr:hypothetical protein [Acholeplasmatales bacterium]
MQRRNNIIISIISTVIVLAIAILFFFIKKNKYNGKKCYVDTVIHTDDYDLSFYKFFRAENSRAAVWIEITVINNTTETKDFKISNVAIKDDSGTIHKASSTTLTINANDKDYYQYGYYCDKNNDTNKYILCFKLNGKKYNVYFRNE